MGYVKHHAIIVTGWENKKVEEAHQKAREIFENNFENEPHQKPFGCRLVGEIIQGLINTQSSFLIAPDGSKEGWVTSENADNARQEFLDWLKNSDNYCGYIEVVFGGDDDNERIIRSKHTDLNK